MDPGQIVASVFLALGGLASSLALVLRQWRLRKRDHEDFLLRMRMLDLNPKAKVLANLNDR